MSMPKDVYDDEESQMQPPDAQETPMDVEALQKKLADAEQKANQYWDRILRMQADNDNMLRRIERDVANAHKYALEKFVAELIPIIDSLELCLANDTNNLPDSAKAIIDGVKLTLKMFYAVLEKFDVKQVNPVSQPFEPEFQQAISMQVDKSVPPGTVISVLQKGYTLNNRLIRPALVIVSKDKE